MTDPSLSLQDFEQVKALAEKLGNLAQVSQFNSADEPQSWTLAYALRDIEGSCLKLADVCIPRLLKCESEDELLATLHDIGEELKHVIYHVKDVRYYSYIELVPENRTVG